MAFNFREYDGEDGDQPSLNQLWADTTADKDLYTRTDALTRIAVRLASDHDHYGAISAAQTAGELFEEMQDAEQVGHSHYFVGWQHSELGNHDDARKAFALASEYFQQAVCEEGRGEALRMLGYAHAQLEDIPSAVAVWHESIRILEACFRYGPAGAILLEIGERQESNNHFEMALETYRKAFENFQIAEDLIGVGRAHIAIAHILQKTDQAISALEHLRNAVIVFDYLSDSEFGRFESAYELALGLELAGFIDEAIKQLEIASKNFKTRRIHGRYADCLIALARLETKLGNPQKAFENRRKARTLLEGCGRDQQVLEIDLADSLIRISDGDDFGAEEILSKALEQCDEDTPLPLVRDIRIALSDIYLRWRRPESALAAIEEFKGGDKDWAFEQKIRWFNAKAAALIASNRASEAFPLLEKAVGLDLGASIPGPTGRSYELLVVASEPMADNQRQEFLANSVALYLKAGLVADATRVSAALAPKSIESALDAIRRADGQLGFLFDPNFLASE